MNQHEYRLLCNAKPTNQLVAYIGQPGDCLLKSRLHSWKLLAQGWFVGALLSDVIVPFSKTKVLETLTYKVEQCQNVFREHDEVLGLKLCLIGHNVFGNIQVAMLCTKHMAFQKTLMSEV
jgi:hypothetical protein